MNKIAKFEKVSEEQFIKDATKSLDSHNLYTEDGLRRLYKEIQLPSRATTGSAGYDFKIPFDMLLNKGNEYLIPTGIRAKISDGWVLKIYPRSGLGFKYGLQLLNTVGIIDSDYYNSDNEGHIMIKITHTIGDYMLKLKQGDGFAQGIFLQYGITEDDDVNGIRNGGFGSTSKK